MTRYRDSRTGKFVSAATWKQSKAHGGTRYVRIRIRTKAQPARPAKPITSGRAKKGKRGAPASPQPEKQKIMWRVTISAPYFYRQSRKKKKSISSSFMIRAWFKTKREAEKAIGELTEIAIEGRNSILKSESRAWWNGDTDEVNIETKEVPYDNLFIGLREEKDERLRD